MLNAAEATSPNHKNVCAAVAAQNIHSPYRLLNTTYGLNDIHTRACRRAFTLTLKMAPSTSHVIINAPNSQLAAKYLIKCWIFTVCIHFYNYVECLRRMYMWIVDSTEEHTKCNEWRKYIRYTNRRPAHNTATQFLEQIKCYTCYFMVFGTPIPLSSVPLSARTCTYSFGWGPSSLCSSRSIPSMHTHDVGCAMCNVCVCVAALGQNIRIKPMNLIWDHETEYFACTRITFGNFGLGNRIRFSLCVHHAPCNGCCKGWKRSTAFAEHYTLEHYT